jgi:nitrogen regulatory protein P-II 1
MKKIEAIFEPTEVEEMRDGLVGLGVRGMTVTEVKGFGSPGGITEVYRGMRYDAPFLLEAKVEIVVADEIAERAVALIREKAKTDDAGGSRIFVFPLEDVGLMRTGKKNAAAA